MKVLISTHPGQHLLFSCVCVCVCVFIVVSLMGVKSYLTMTFTCISVMTPDAKHLHVLIVVCLYFLLLLILLILAIILLNPLNRLP